MLKLLSAEQAARNLRPEASVTCLRPQAARKAAEWFTANFPGQILYAVKTNPDPVVLDALYAGGIRRFDVASLAEIELIHERFADAGLCYMHPVKSRASIRRAYQDYGIRDFSLDSEAELEKILDSTGGARDLGLFLRLAVPNDDAEVDLTAKFGIPLDKAAGLLLRCRQLAKRLGVTFHVGSQCMNPGAYATALERVSRTVVQSGVILDVIDIGGGFPSAYPGMTPPPLASYIETITRTFDTLPITETCELWCEPGRALAAEAASTLVRVELRKDRMLHINDGTYGSLFDAGGIGFIFPARAFRPDGVLSSRTLPFGLYGPTCDGIDVMKGPFELPADIEEGDYIEIGMTGAYGAALRTQFNGFHSDHRILVQDPPMTTLYASVAENLPETDEDAGEAAL